MADRKASTIVFGDVELPFVHKALSKAHEHSFQHNDQKGVREVKSYFKKSVTLTCPLCDFEFADMDSITFTALFKHIFQCYKNGNEDHSMAKIASCEGIAFHHHVVRIPVPAEGAARETVRELTDDEMFEYIYYYNNHEFRNTFVVSTHALYKVNLLDDHTVVQKVTFSKWRVHLFKRLSWEERELWQERAFVNKLNHIEFNRLAVLVRSFFEYIKRHHILDGDDAPDEFYW